MTTPNDRRPKGITVHRTRSLPGSDVRRNLGIPVTSPSRTIFHERPDREAARLRRIFALRDGRDRRNRAA